MTRLALISQVACLHFKIEPSNRNKWREINIVVIANKKIDRGFSPILQIEFLE